MKDFFLWGSIIALSALFMWILIFGFYIVLFPKKEIKNVEKSKATKNK